MVNEKRIRNDDTEEEKEKKEEKKKKKKKDKEGANNNGCNDGMAFIPIGAEDEGPVDELDM